MVSSSSNECAMYMLVPWITGLLLLPGVTLTSPDRVQCPATHPNVYYNGNFCCKSDREKEHAPQRRNCDGSVIQRDGESYCLFCVPCPSVNCESFTADLKWQQVERGVLMGLDIRGASESAGNPNAKIWSIFIREERLKIRCNGELLLDHCLCQVDCNVSDYDQGKMNDLKRNIGEIQFHNTADKASLEWRNYDASHGTHCKDPNITNALPLPEKETPVDDTLKVKCRARHVLFGERTITCESDGTWSSTPTCNRYEDTHCIQKCDSSGIHYRGFVNRTMNGRLCQKWTSQTPNTHTRTQHNYPDAGLGDHNYCRNPDGGPWPWCYNSQRRSPRWELCDIPYCDSPAAEKDCGPKSLGCWTDNVNRAIAGGIRLRSSENPIEKCHNFAKEQGFSVFAVQNNIECFTAADAAETYKKYGESSGCSNGRGGSWAQNVYQVACEGWKQVEDDQKIVHNLETQVLEIKKNSDGNGGDKIDVNIYKSDRILGTLKIEDDGGKYTISSCTDGYVYFPPKSCGTSTVEGELDTKIWSIYKSEDRLVMKCNGAFVLNLSQDDCDLGTTSVSTTIWRSDTVKVQLDLKPQHASFQWRTCNAPQDSIFHCNDPNIANAKPFVEGRAPLYKTVKVKCRARHVLFGERKITCKSDGTWSSTPTCKRYDLQSKISDELFQNEVLTVEE